MTNCLPTKDLHRIKHVNVDAICPICQVENESVLHALVTCPFAEYCHQRSLALMVHGEFRTFADWMQLIFDQQSQAATLISVTICWQLWKNRNDSIWKQKSIDSSELVNSVFSILNQWKVIQDKNYSDFLGLMTSEDDKEQWQPPMSNSVKINTDAALFEDPKRYSFAFIIRDQHGSLIEAISKCSSGQVAPEFAEAMGIREALSWIKNKNHSNVVLETDCLQIVQLLRNSFI